MFVSRVQLLDRILTETLTFPDNLDLSAEMKDLLNRLLQKVTPSMLRQEKDSHAILPPS